MTAIRVIYDAIDGSSRMKRFKTVEGARAFATKYVGESPEIGSSYAVSADGIGRITVDGCNLADLFAKKPAGAAAYPFQVFYYAVNEDSGEIPRQVMAKAFGTLEAAGAYAEEISAYCDGVSVKGATEEAQAEIDAANEAAMDAAQAPSVPPMPEDPYGPYRAAGCTCSDMQLNLVGCDCDAGRF